MNVRKKWGARLQLARHRFSRKREYGSRGTVDDDVLTNEIRRSTARRIVRRLKHRVKGSPFITMVSDSGATATMINVSSITRSGGRVMLVGGKMKKTSTVFRTASPNEPGIRPIGTGDMVTVMLDEAGVAWVVVMKGVFIFKDADVKQCFLSPASLQKSWKEQSGCDHTLLCTGTHSMSHLELGNNDNTVGKFKCVVADRTFYNTIQAVDALLQHEPATGTRASKAFRGDLDIAAEELDRVLPGWRDESSSFKRAYDTYVNEKKETNRSSTNGQGTKRRRGLRKKRVAPKGSRVHPALLRRYGMIEDMNGDELDQELVEIDAKTTKKLDERIQARVHQRISPGGEPRRSKRLSKLPEAESITQDEPEPPRSPGPPPLLQASDPPAPDITTDSKVDETVSNPVIVNGGGGVIDLDNPQLTTTRVNDSTYTDHSHGKPVTIGISEKAVRLRTRKLTRQALHYVLGHPSDYITTKTRLKYIQLSNQKQSDEPNQERVKEDEQSCGAKCPSCTKGKSRFQRRAREAASTRTTRPGQRVWFDTAGPFPDGRRMERYMTIAVDEYTGYIWTSMASDNSSASALLALRAVTNELAMAGYRLTSIRSDNGNEFSGDFAQYLHQAKIHHEHSAYYSPHENGRAERSILTIMNKARCMLTHAAMDEIGCLWVEVLRHATELHNVTYKKSQEESPWERLHPNMGAPSAEGLLVWGAHCIIHGDAIPKQWTANSKMSVKGLDGYYMGRSRTAKHVGRYFVPKLGSNGSFIETLHSTTNDALERGARLLQPSLLNKYQDGGDTIGNTLDRFHWFDEGDDDINLNELLPPADAVDVAKSGQEVEVNDTGYDGARPMVGSRTARYFNGGWYGATIVEEWSKKPRGKPRITYYNVKHDDGDVEDFSLSEMLKVNEIYNDAKRRTRERDDEQVETVSHWSNHGLEQAFCRRRYGAGIETTNYNTQDLLTKLGNGEQFDDCVGVPDDYYDGMRLVEDEGANRLDGTKLITDGAGLLGEQEEAKIADLHQEVRWVHFDGNGEGEYIDILEATEEERACSMRVSIPSAYVYRKGKVTGGDERPYKVGSLGDFGSEGGLPEFNYDLEDVNITMQREDRRKEFVAWSQNFEDSESIEDEDAGIHYVYRCTLKESGRAVYIDCDQPPIALTMRRDHPQHKEWLKAHIKELKEQVSLNAFNVCERSEIPPGTLVLKSGWRCVRKVCPRTGAVKRLKSRAFIKGYAMQPGVHYVETTSPTLRPQTLRLLLSAAAEHRLTTQSFDVSSAFLCSYIDQPVWFNTYDYAEELIPDVVPRKGTKSRAVKAIYGAKQSGRCWYLEFTKTLKNLGFKVSKGDECLLWRATGPNGEVLEDYDIDSHYDDRKQLAPDLREKQLAPDLPPRRRDQLELKNESKDGSMGESKEESGQPGHSDPSLAEIWSEYERIITIDKREEDRGDHDVNNVNAAETGYIEPISEIKSSSKKSKFSDLTSIKHDTGVKVIYLAIYVDDMAAAATDQATLNMFYEDITKFYKVRDEGPLSEFLGVVINRHEDGSIGLTQSSKCVKIAEAAGIIDEDVSKCVLPMRVSTGPLSVPTTPRDQMDQAEVDLVNSIDYRSVIGQALHLYVYTRPDIGYSIGQLARHCNDVRGVHVKAAKELARYLLRTKDLEIRYTRGTNRNVNVYCDADYADCPDTRRSITGYVVMLNGGAVSWSSKKQTSIALSTLEAEAMAGRSAFCEIMGLKLDLDVIDRTLARSQWIVHEDNQSLMAVINKPLGGRYEARKHIAVRVLWMREVVASGILRVVYVKSEDQVADTLTKGLSEESFVRHRDTMMGTHCVQHVHRCYSARVRGRAYARCMRIRRAE